MYKTQPTMASLSSRRAVIKLASVVGFTGLSGCLSPTDETSPVKLLYIMLTNNVDHEQEIELQVVTKGSPDFSVTVEMPPAGTESSEVPGTTAPNQFMIVPNTNNLHADTVVKARYAHADSWVETAFTDADHRHVAGWITLWPPGPDVGYYEYPEEPSEETGEVEGAGITVDEAEEFVESFIEDQGDRDYTIGD